MQTVHMNYQHVDFPTAIYTGDSYILAILSMYQLITPAWPLCQDMSNINILATLSMYQLITPAWPLCLCVYNCKKLATLFIQVAATYWPLYVQMYLCVSVCVCVNIYIYIYIHTYLHKHTLSEYMTSTE